MRSLERDILQAIAAGNLQAPIPVVTGRGDVGHNTLAEVIGDACGARGWDALLLAVLQLDVPEVKALREFIARDHADQYQDELDLICAEEEASEPYDVMPMEVL